MRQDRRLLLTLFGVFAKIGLFTFGGGYAMLALIEDQCVERKRWLTHDDLAAVTAIAESTPGPIAINCATYTGYRQAGLLGAVCATLGLVLPSFVIIYLISLFFDRFLDIPLVANAFWGIKAGVGVLDAVRAAGGAAVGGMAAGDRCAGEHGGMRPQAPKCA